MERSIVAQIAELERMPIDGLREKWNALFDMPPPASSNPKQLVARLAYRIQELAFGGLSREAREKLDRIASRDIQGGDGKAISNSPDHHVPGTKFIREWQGRRIEVLALDKGFEYAGKRYRSLSAIATEITGTKWNGPDFFGLRQKASNNKNTPVSSNTALATRSKT